MQHCPRHQMRRVDEKHCLLSANRFGNPPRDKTAEWLKYVRNARCKYATVIEVKLLLFLNVVPNHEAWTAVIWIISSGFLSAFRPSNAGMIIVGMATDSPKSSRRKFFTMAANTCSVNRFVSFTTYASNRFELTCGKMVRNLPASATGLRSTLFAAAGGLASLESCLQTAEMKSEQIWTMIAVSLFYYNLFHFNHAQIIFFYVNSHSVCYVCNGVHVELSSVDYRNATKTRTLARKHPLTMSRCDLGNYAGISAWVECIVKVTNAGPSLRTSIYDLMSDIAPTHFWVSFLFKIFSVSARSTEKIVPSHIWLNRGVASGGESVNARSIKYGSLNLRNCRTCTTAENTINA